METVFDYNPTAKELNIIGIWRTKDKYIEFMCDDTKNLDLAELMFMRGQRDKMRTYLDNVKDTMRVNSFWRTITHPIQGSKE